MQNFNELYETIGQKKLYLSSIHDEAGQPLPVEKQEAFFVHCVDNFQINDETQEAVLKNGMLTARTAITEINTNGSFDLKSFNPLVLAIIRGQKLVQGSYSTKAVSATIPETGELPITLEQGQAIVSFLNVVSDDARIFRMSKNLTPAAGEFVVDFVNSELIFNVADAGKKVAISRMYSDPSKGAMFQQNAISDVFTKRGARMVIEDTYSGEIEVFENVSLSISRTKTVADYASASVSFTAAASPLTGVIYTHSFPNFQW